MAYNVNAYVLLVDSILLDLSVFNGYDLFNMLERSEENEFQPGPEVSGNSADYVEQPVGSSTLRYPHAVHAELAGQPPLNSIVQRLAQLTATNAENSGLGVEYLQVVKSTEEEHNTTGEDYTLELHITDFPETFRGLPEEMLAEAISDFDEELSPEDKTLSDKVRLSVIHPEEPKSAKVSEQVPQPRKKSTSLSEKPKAPTTARRHVLNAGLAVLGIAAGVGGVADGFRRRRRDASVERRINAQYPPVTDAQYNAAHAALEGISKGKPLSPMEVTTNQSILGQQVINHDQMKNAQDYPFSNIEGGGQAIGVATAIAGSIYAVNRLLSLRGRRMRENAAKKA